MRAFSEGTEERRTRRGWIELVDALLLFAVPAGYPVHGFDQSAFGHGASPVKPVTGSLTGDIILAVGGVTEKIRSIMDPVMGMEGACIPWLNKYDIEPLLVNADNEYIQKDDIPGIRIYRGSDKQDPFDIYFCKTKYNAYKILMGLEKEEIENRMADRSKQDLAFMQSQNGN